MAQPFDHIPQELKQAAAGDAAPPKPRRGRGKGPAPAEASSGGGKSQRRPIKYKRANVVLTEEQVREIKAGRKQLRRDMKKQHIYSKKEFELTASSLGLYFDRGSGLALLGWLFRGRGLWALLGALALLLFALAVLSWAVQLRGHFTINLSPDMMREGFLLSETEDFANPTTHLFSQPALDVPCISISDIPENVDQVDGSHNQDYFAYTYYIRNEGEEPVSYRWQIALNSESKALGVAAWVMVFEDGEMSFYAKPRADGQPEALPGFDDQRHGYIEPALRQYLADPAQYELVRTRGSVSYYRAVPQSFLSDTVITRGDKTHVAVGGTHKYTVVIWLEGDDPDCTDALVGGHIGLEMEFRVLDEQGVETGTNWWRKFTGKLLFWQEKKTQ